MCAPKEYLVKSFINDVLIENLKFGAPHFSFSASDKFLSLASIVLENCEVTDVKRSFETSISKKFCKNFFFEDSSLLIMFSS